MKKTFYLTLIGIMLLSNIAVYANGIDSLVLSDVEMKKLKKYFPVEESHVTWKGDPLVIELPMGKEKRIIFPAHVSVDIKGALTTDQLRLVNNDKSIYLTAIKSFSSTRIYVTVEGSGKVVLIDLSTNENASGATQHIDFNQDDSQLENKMSSNATSSAIAHTNPMDEVTEDSQSDPKLNEVNYVDLMRFAWQQVYSPERLLHDASHYSRSPMHTETFISDLVYGDKVVAHPESSWIVGDHYITVVLLRNKYSHPTSINLQKDLCGDWQAASLYPRSSLKPYGDKKADSTTLFLVSSHPFGEAVGVCHGDA